MIAENKKDIKEIPDHKNKIATKENNKDNNKYNYNNEKDFYKKIKSYSKLNNKM